MTEHHRTLLELEWKTSGKLHRRLRRRKIKTPHTHLPQPNGTPVLQNLIAWGSKNAKSYVQSEMKRSAATI
jgi:hypothetical protein